MGKFYNGSNTYDRYNNIQSKIEYTFENTYTLVLFSRNDFMKCKILNRINLYLCHKC